MTNQAKKWTKPQTEAFLAKSFTNRIAWVAARSFLEQVVAEPIDAELRDRIREFLDRNPLDGDKA